jgi:hypothetical protein
MTNPASTPARNAQVVQLPVRVCDPKSPDALVQLAQRHGAWRRANPHATADEDIAAGARIAKELGL